MSKSRYMTYEQSGVSINAAEQSGRRIHSKLSRTFDGRVPMELADGFAGLVRFDKNLFTSRYKHPLFASCVDGVGTKVMIAQEMKKFYKLGTDLVAMNVNDMLVLGAEPWFFLDYLAVDKMRVNEIDEIIDGIVEACKNINCLFIGGETAEMHDIYRENEFDLAGFAVGVVEESRIITAKNVKQGDVILGLESSGLHSNGYTLARDICFNKAGLKVTDTIDELEGSVLGDVLLEPTRIYVNPIIKLLLQYKVKKVIHAMAHITGGGLVGNIPRVLPKTCNAVIKKSSWPVPPIFSFLQRKGPVEESEMFRVFNMGIGFVLIVAPDFANSIAKKLKRYGEEVYKIGTVTAGTGKAILK